MTRLHFVIPPLFVVVLASACEDERPPPLGPVQSASSEGDDDDENTGGSAGDVGSEGGMGGAPAGMGGEQGDCLTCSGFEDACDEGNCPEKNELCADSYDVYTDMVSCICGACYDACKLTCTGDGGDHGDCGECQEKAIEGQCGDAVDACHEDDNYS